MSLQLRWFPARRDVPPSSRHSRALVLTAASATRFTSSSTRKPPVQTGGEHRLGSAIAGRLSETRSITFAGKCFFCLTWVLLAPPAGDGVLRRRFHHRFGKEHQRQLAEGGLDRLHLQGDSQGWFSGHSEKPKFMYLIDKLHQKRRERWTNPRPLMNWRLLLSG